MADGVRQETASTPNDAAVHYVVICTCGQPCPMHGPAQVADYEEGDAEGLRRTVQRACRAAVEARDIKTFINLEKRLELIAEQFTAEILALRAAPTPVARSSAPTPQEGTPHG